MKGIQCFSCFSIVLFLAINIICGKALYCYMCKRWLSYCMPVTLLLKMRAESCEQWKLIALRISLSAPKLLYQCSGTAFLCLKTNRSICEKEEEKPNHPNKMHAHFQTAFLPLGGPANYFTVHHAFSQTLGPCSHEAVVVIYYNLLACSNGTVI